MNLDKRVDAYIQKSADFAKPILLKIRDIVHKACPEAVETIKWSFPHFMYKGEILCSMASFKAHCAFGFWKGTLIPELNENLKRSGKTAMGQFGRLQSIGELPSDRVFISYVKKAMALTDKGVKLTNRNSSKDKPALTVPDYFRKVLNKNKKAAGTFESFSYSCQKEYLEWITEAKTEATRNKRIQTSIEWLEKGKDRNWKYHS